MLGVVVYRSSCLETFSIWTFFPTVSVLKRNSIGLSLLEILTAQVSHWAQHYSLTYSIASVLVLYPSRLCALPGLSFVP